MNNDMPLKQVIDSTLENLKKVMSTDTIIGEPIHVLDNTVIIPVSKVSVGFTSGGVDFDSKKNTDKHFGGGNGAGMSVSPIAFLVVRDTGVEILNINKDGSAADSISELITKAPDLINRVKDTFKKKKPEEMEKTEE